MRPAPAFSTCLRHALAVIAAAWAVLAATMLAGWGCAQLIDWAVLA